MASSLGLGGQQEAVAEVAQKQLPQKTRGVPLKARIAGCVVLAVLMGVVWLAAKGQEVFAVSLAAILVIGVLTWIHDAADDVRMKTSTGILVKHYKPRIATSKTPTSWPSTDGAW
jgi:hypothetical protein